VTTVRLHELMARSFKFDAMNAAVRADERDIVLVEGDRVPTFVHANVLATENPVLPADHPLDLGLWRLALVDRWGSIRSVNAPEPTLLLGPQLPMVTTKPGDLSPRPVPAVPLVTAMTGLVCEHQR
jgi:hypothetical protein